MKISLIGGSALFLLASPAFALNILISNDDGLTSNIRALYETFKADGHDVIVSTPCTGQSVRGGAMIMYSPTTIVADNDHTQIEAEGGCHNGAAPIGAPAVGPYTKSGFNNGDWYYVHGSPIMATMYGIDVLAQKRWGKAPDLVLSGPNEGQNVGKIVVNSGTVSNVQFSARRNIPSIALSGGPNSADNKNLANPLSPIIAAKSLQLVKALQAKAGKGPLLPPGIIVNMNTPDNVTMDTPFAFSRVGTYNYFAPKFMIQENAKGERVHKLDLAFNKEAPTAAQADDETALIKNKIAVTAYQMGYEAPPQSQRWLRKHLSSLFK